jgi:hypothetical protein
MNVIIKNRMEMFIGVDTFGEEPGLPVNARATALFTDNKTVITNMTASSSAQADGRGRYHGASTDRRETAAELRAMLRKIGGIGKVLDSAAFPDLKQQLRMPRSAAYQALIASALAFKTAVTPTATKAAFVARGMAADFDVDLDDLIETLQDATSRKIGGRGTQSGGTAGLLAESRRGLTIVRELDAIMNVILATNPTLLAHWKTVSHVQRPPQRASEPTTGGTTPPPPSGNGSGI